jgi:hypothetical protein
VARTKKLDISIKYSELLPFVVYILPQFFFVGYLKNKVVKQCGVGVEQLIENSVWKSTNRKKLMTDKQKTHDEY